MRVKRGTTGKRRHKSVLERTKGFRMTKGRLYKVSKEADLHAGQYAFAGRKLKKRQTRNLWITRINGALSAFEMPYSKFIAGMKTAKIELNRKVLTDLIKSEPEGFKKVVETVKKGTEHKTSL